MRERPGPTPLVGRDREASWLRGASGAAADGSGAARLLLGAPGLGKTALLTELCDATSGPVRVLRAAATRGRAESGFGVVRELLGPDAAARAATLPGGARWAQAALADPGTDRTDGGSAVGAVGAVPELHGALHALYWLTVDLTGDGPLLLVVDDLQWSDDESLAFLGFLLRRLSGLPLGVVLAARPGPGGGPGERLTGIAAAAGDAVRTLAPLDRDDVRRLAALRAGAPPDESRLDTLVRVSGGNPLLVEQLVPDGGGEIVLPAEASEEVVDDLVEHQVRLGGAAPTAVALAVVGEAGEDLLAAVARVPTATVRESLAALAACGLTLPGRAAFRHDRLRGAVLRRCAGPGELDTLRRRAGRVLSDAGSPAELVAGILEPLPAPPEPWMVDVFAEAADSAARRGAPGTEARLLDLVVRARPDDVEVRLRLAATIGQRDPDRALDHLQHALDVAHDMAGRARAAAAFAMTALAVQRAPEGVELLERVLTELDGDTTPAAAELRTHLEAALLVVGLDEKRTVAPTMARMRAMSVPEGRTPAERQKLAMMTVATAMQGGPAVAAVDGARRVLLADDGGLGGWAALASSLVLRLGDETAESDAVLDRLVVAARDRASAWTYALVTGTRSTNRLATGDLLEAELDALAALEITSRETWSDNAVVPTIALASVRVHRGDPAGAEELLDGISRPRTEDFAWEYHDLLMVRAGARAVAGDTEGALRTYEHCGRSLAEAGIANPVFAPWWAEAAMLLGDLGRHREAAAAAEHGEELADRWGTPRGAGLALLAAAAADPARAHPLLAEAVDALERSPARLDQARARRRLGTELLRQGRVRAARSQLRTAAQLAARCGAVHEAGTARDLLVAAGGRMRRPRGSPLDSLTAAEHRVVRLAAEGLRNREIAEALFVTLRTVEVHLTGAYRKLGVADRSALTALVGAATAGEGVAPASGSATG